MELPPAGLIEGHRLPRRLRVNGGGAWFLAGPGSFNRVGAGDLSHENLQAVFAELGERVFVSLPAPRQLEEFLGPQNKWAIFRPRLYRYEKLRRRVQPTIETIGREAQVAVLPGLGAVWVDGHRLFHDGETVPLPWTEPVVSLVAVRPRTVIRAMRRAIGPRGPKRISEPLP